jgi:hypothetical protein
MVEIFLGAAVIFMYSLNQLLIWSILYMTAEKTSLIDTADQNKGEKICQKYVLS